MSVLLVRHAEAGDRSHWDGPDRLRPLTPHGRHQATALVDVLADYPAARIVSSPYIRCVETVEPLAVARGLVAEEHDDLAEGAPLDAVRRWLDTPGAVLCSHGDVIEAVLMDLANRGVDLGDHAQLAKGSTWVLDLDAGTAQYLPAPRVDAS